MTFKRLSFFLSLPFLLTVARAEKPSGPPERQPPWTLGVGVVHITRAYRNLGDRTVPLPFISYQGKNFFFQGPKAGARVRLHPLISIGAQARYQFGGYDPDDDEYFRGMAERKDAVEVGGLVSVRIPGRFRVELDYFKDVSNRHQGQSWDVSLARPFFIQKWRLIPSANVEWTSGNESDYYYGVEQNEARANRPAIEIPKTTQFSLGLTSLYQLSERWFSMVSFSWTRLDSDIEKSPLVDTRNKTRAILGATYKF